MGLSARLTAILAGTCECDRMSATPDYELITAADCPLCGRSGTMVVPDYCSEDHAADCSERMCLECGSALFVDPVVRPGKRTA
jgi:hypothetical protein